MNFCVFRCQCFVRVIILASFQEEKYLLLFLVSSLFESVESIQELFTKSANVYNCTFEQQMNFLHFDQDYFFWNWLRTLYYKVICRKCFLLLSDFHVEIRAKLFDVKLVSICIHTFQASGQRMSQGLGMLCQTTCYCNQNKSHKSRRSRQAERKPVYVH